MPSYNTGMDNLALVIVIFMILALGMETGWNAHRWRVGKSIAQKDKENEEIKASRDRLQKLLAKETARNKLPPIRDARDMLDRMPKFSDDEQAPELLPTEHEGDEFADCDRPASNGT